MYRLIIDGQLIARNQYIKPLVDQLIYAAQADGFEEATITSK